MSKFAAVFGAAGFIGSKTVRTLLEAGWCVEALARGTQDRLLALELRELGTKHFGHLCISACDVGYPEHRNECHVAAERQRSPNRYDAVICCIGHCPPGGFADAVKIPISGIQTRTIEEELGWHVMVPLWIFQAMLLVMKDGGCMVFMSSAATRILDMPRDKRPPLQIYPHLAAIAAENALIEGMRMAPQVIKRGIRIHKIMPPAISDSPFHQGAPLPPSTVTSDEVVAAISNCLDADDHQDKNLVPLPARSGDGMRYCGP